MYIAILCLLVSVVTFFVTTEVTVVPSYVAPLVTTFAVVPLSDPTASVEDAVHRIL